MHDLEMNADGTARMFSVREVPWHGLGVILQTAPATAEEALKEAGLDWTVSLEEVNVCNQVVPNVRAVVRSTDQRTLGIVAPGFKPIQNSTAMAVLDGLVQNGDATYETAGALKGGSIVWMLVHITDMEIVTGDIIKRYALVSNGHGVNRSANTMTTDTRVVCANTLQVAQTSGVNIARVNHVGNVEKGMDDARKTLTGLINRAVDDAEKYRALAAAKITEEELKGYLLNLFPNEKPGEGETEEDVDNEAVENLRNNIVGLYTTMPERENLPAIGGTWWAAFNAVTEAITHKGVASSGRRESRLASLWFGSARRATNKALSLALASV